MSTQDTNELLKRVWDTVAVGTPVTVTVQVVRAGRVVTREVETKTRSKAWMADGGRVVVMVDDLAGPFPVERVRVRRGA